MPRRNRNAPPTPRPTASYIGWDPRRLRFVRRREPLIDLPSLGFPTEEETRRLHAAVVRARGRGDGMRLQRVAVLRSMTWEDWGERLTGNDIEWALRAVRYLKHLIRAHEALVVERALKEDMGWDAIGAILGVSRQAIAQRWGRLADVIWQERAHASGADDLEGEPP